MGVTWRPWRHKEVEGRHGLRLAHAEVGGKEIIRVERLSWRCQLSADGVGS